MDDVLTKPIELAELNAKIEQWFPSKGQAHDDAAGGARSAADTRDLTETSLTMEFCLAHDEDVGALRAAIRDRRRDALARATHRIKGAARMYGDTGLAEAAAALERIVAANSAWESAEAAARKVETETDRLFAQIGWMRKSRSA
jgi:HPt (histidine-containing phosphotransfer) domain-containing protein